MEYAFFLRNHIEKIVSLTDEEFLEVLKFFFPKNLEKKDFLIRGGEKVSSEFLVAKGLLKAFLHDEKGKEYIVQFAMENWWISDYAAFKEQGKGEICVQALENCFVLELSWDNRKKMCEKVPKMYQFHGDKAFGGFVALQKRVLSMMKNSPKEKYELLLDQYPILFQRVSKTIIANYLGVSRETLSRLSQ